MKLQFRITMTAIAIAALTRCAVIRAEGQNTSPTRKSFPESKISLPEYGGIYAVDSRGHTTKLKRVDFAELNKLRHLTEAEKLAKLSKLNLETRVEFLVYGKEPAGAPMLLRADLGEEEKEVEKIALLEKPIKAQPEMRRFIPEAFLAPGIYMLSWLGFDAQGQPQYMFVVGLEQLKEGSSQKLIEAETRATRAQIDALSTALKLYRLDTGKYPASIESLFKDDGSPNSRGPYCKGEAVDAWGTPLMYGLREGRPRITSIGPDKIAGTRDDIEVNY